MENTHKLPLFTFEIDAWFHHIDAIWPPEFKDDQKYRVLLLALPTDLVTLLQGHTTDTSAGGKYEEAKSTLLRALGKPKELYLAQLDAIQGGTQRPSLLLSRIRSLSAAAGAQMPDQLLRHRLLHLVPQEIRLHLASLPSTATLHEFVARADTLFDAHVASSPSALQQSGLVLNPYRVSSVCDHASEPVCASIKKIDNKDDARNNMAELINKVMNRLDDLERRLTANEKNAGNENQRERRFTAPHQVKMCYYHRRFGDTARKCEHPCSFQGNAWSGSQ